MGIWHTVHAEDNRARHRRDYARNPAPEREQQRIYWIVNGEKHRKKRVERYWSDEEYREKRKADRRRYYHEHEKVKPKCQ